MFMISAAYRESDRLSLNARIGGGKQAPYESA